MQPQRACEIERAVDVGLWRWKRSGAELNAPPPRPAQTGVLRALPRRQLVHRIEAAHVSLPMARRPVFKPGILLPFVRLSVWLAVALAYVFGNAFDSLLGRASVERRAVRFRRLLEWAGGSMIKVGQQLSVRADLLPYAFCDELSKLLDDVPPIPAEEAIKILERNLGRPIKDVFEAFDPVPIGSASLACVYQAVLKTGEHVAVKIQRPGIGRLISADLRALDWLLIAGEALTLIRPGMTTQFRRELRKTLIGELNFRTEARYNEMFRLRVEEDNEGITAPRVFFDYCTEEVLVNELVAGTWMWEFMVAVDKNDQEFLGKLRKEGIEPGIVARRLLRVLHRELLEHLFFHGDPHPANLIVLPDSRICFIDFGAIGRFSTETRNGWRELLFHMQNRDVERMVRSSLTLAGRLPPINVDDVLEAMEEIYADWVYAISSTDAEWWERCSAQTWLRHIKVARQFGMPVTLEMIQFFRATFLYDTMIVRLDRTIDPIAEWKSYAKVAGKAARKRVHREIRQRVNGPTGVDYLRIEALADTMSQFFFRVQRNLDDPIFQFRQTVGKLAFGISTVLRLAYTVAVLFGFAVIAEYLARVVFGIDRLWSMATLEAIASLAWLKLIGVIVALVVIRQVIIRMSEPDSPPAGRG